jgi:hypothetical protein
VTGPLIDQEAHEGCVPIGELSAALDEIYRLRRALAYESMVALASLDYASFPKGRRAATHDSASRMQAAARGQSEEAYSGTNSRSLRYAAVEVGAGETFTRAQFREERGL